MNFLKGFLTISVFWMGVVNAEQILDKSRDRLIPFEVSYPLDKVSCTPEIKCPVAFLSAGYGVSHTKYSFLVNQLIKLGYMVVAIGHELPSDPHISVKGNLFETRTENWVRGARTLDFLKNELQTRYQEYEFEALLLIGHSNGGDISSWLGNEAKPYVKSIITLDHRRVPLPRTKYIDVLSIRGSDFPADTGVLPSQKESIIFGSCIIKIPESRHNDMSDYGPNWLKDRIATLVKNYLSKRACTEE
ncbi:alpha/beta hydrolase [Paraglaciecola sp. 25GB23A]|uniref:alpha/beta hydrolase n=1 Tax=Paraglaciecola sp. 25GB23A TaxID=3156068 RepID=UPI0032AF9CD3